jgi:hypothetical protein
MIPLEFLPIEIQARWHASLYSAPPDPEVGAYKLLQIEPTEPKGYMGQRITVLVLDENERPIPNVEVVFAYDTGKQIFQEGIWKWVPPSEGRKGDVVPTRGDGMAEHIQGSVVKDDEPGGITLWIKDPDRPCDYMRGLGMLYDHTGLYVVYQRQDAGVVSDNERLTNLELNQQALEDAIGAMSDQLKTLEGRVSSMGLRPSAVRYESANE